MKVEISKEQQEALGQKIAMCLDFLRKNIQPHLVVSDTVVKPMGDVLDLWITPKEIYVTRTRVVNMVFDFEVKKKLLLEKTSRKMSKYYICEAFPELAVEFLQHWERVKADLLLEVGEKNAKIDKLDKFVNDFKL